MPGELVFAKYCAVGDSLAGASQSTAPQIFTLNWQGAIYSGHLLRTDGLGQGDVRGLEQLGDTVYAGTTSGFFKQPTKGFFVTKQQ